MNRRVPVSGGGTGVDPATATYFARRNAQAVIIGRRTNVLEHSAEAIGGVFPDARPGLVRWNAFGIRGQGGSRLAISRPTRPAEKVAGTDRRCVVRVADRWAGAAFSRACRPSCVPSGPNAATPAPHS
ncbi:putative 3-oxacyl-ACP reductase [Burkholderia lata]|nr:putative 3-oxacyl-ACP reductase [Burkholderia lata]